MPEYEWILCKSPSNSAPFATLEKIANITKAKNRQFQLVRNRGGSASFQIRTDDDLAAEILDNVDLNDIRGTVRKCIRIRRDKVDLWSGPIWGIQGDLDAGTLNINCVGWLEQIQKRILWNTLDYSNGGVGTAPSVIVSGLINAVNAQDPAHPLLIRPGSVTGSVDAFPRIRQYLWGQTILGPALQELSDIEAGYDYVVDPITREVNLFSWDSYNDRTDIRLGYNWGPKNLKNVQWQEDASKTVNFMGIISQGAPVYVDDPTSKDQYGLFEEYNTISGANQAILQPYGVSELVIRSRPLVTYTLIPGPRMGTEGPTLFDDFQIGEKVYWSAKKDNVTITGQAIRVFGASVSLDDNENETVTSLQTSPASGGAGA